MREHSDTAICQTCNLASEKDYVKRFNMFLKTTILVSANMYDPLCVSASKIAGDDELVNRDHDSFGVTDWLIGSTVSK
jgi:hypothetical protein